MSDDAINAAIASFNENPGSMDSLGNTVYSSVASDVPDAPADAAAAPVEEEVAATETPVAETQVAPTPEQQDEIDKLLEAEGIAKQSIRGENRIPYSRTKKIIENAQLKWKAEYEKTIGEERRTWQEGQARLTNYDQQARLADSDPDRYIALLASLDPRYQKFASPQQPAQAQKPPVDDDPEPQPLQDANGPYSTPELWKKHQEWTIRQAEKRAIEKLEAKYGKTLQSVQQEREAQAAIEARRPVVEKQMQRIIKTYGEDLVAKHQQDIIKLMRDEGISAAEAAGEILLPKMKQDQASMRASILEELNRRPAAAASAAVPAAKKPASELVPQTLEDKMLAEINRQLPNRNR